MKSAQQNIRHQSFEEQPRMTSRPTGQTLVETRGTMMVAQEGHESACERGGGAMLCVLARLRACSGGAWPENAGALSVRLLQCAIVILPFIVGCLVASPSRPLTTADLEVLATGSVLHASLERVGNGPAVSFGGDSSNLASRMLKSLSPVISHEAVIDRDASGGHEYVYMHQSGRDPLVFSIRVCGDILCYRVGSTEYKGGDSSKFLDIVEEIAPSKKSNPKSVLP